MSARLTVRQVDQVTVVDAAGRITLGEGASSMRDKLSELLKAGKSKILVNLRGVSCIDSAGIGELVDTLTTVKSRGGQLKLLTLTKKVERRSMITVIELSTIFEIFDSEVTAIRSFGASDAVGST